MDHRSAQESQAAERYLLGEMPAVEAEEFELHYFECQFCAVAVESGQEFIGEVRSGAQPVSHSTNQPINQPINQPKREDSRPPFWESVAAFWRRPAFALVAMAALAIVGLYQGLLVIPSLRQTLDEARPLPAFQLIGASRGEDPAVHVSAGTRYVSLAADIPPDVHFTHYLCVVAGGGQVALRVVNPAPDAGHPITILVPVDRLKAGRNELTVTGLGSGKDADGQPGEKISSYPFDFAIN